jgi:hypothetical protein
MFLNASALPPVSPRRNTDIKDLPKPSAISDIGRADVHRMTNKDRKRPREHVVRAQSKKLWKRLLSVPAPWEIVQAPPVDLSMIRETGRPRWRKVSHRELRRLQAAQRRLTALRKHRAQESAKAAANKWHEMRRTEQGRAGVS